MNAKGLHVQRLDQHIVGAGINEFKDAALVFRRRQKQGIAFLACWRLAEVAAEVSRLQAGHGHIGDDDLSRTTQDLRQSIRQIIDQHRLVSELLDLLHQRLEVFQRDTDQLNVQAWRERAPVFAVGNRTHPTHRRSGGEYFRKGRDVLSAHVQFGTPFAPALDHAVDQIVQRIAANAKTRRARKK